jgi:hypothetical protein
MGLMLAAVLRDVDKLELEDVERPAPGAGEVVVRVRSCGICQTDYKAIKGIRKNVTFPTIVGHEPAGIVADVGPRRAPLQVRGRSDLPALGLLRLLRALPGGAVNRSRRRVQVQEGCPLPPGGATSASGTC